MHDKLHATASDSLLITGGSGGVGGFAIQLARHLGLETIITTCSAKNMGYVRQLGATRVIDYEAEDPLARVLELTEGRGVTLAIDTVGPDNDLISANALAFEGQMVELVSVVAPQRYRDAFARGLTFHQLSLGAAHRNGPAAKAGLVAAGKAFTELVERGIIGAPALETIPIDGVAHALREMLKQRTRGKIVMVW
jgi:NADPH:quinone reductase-like Zn-dependent oxidoreductase